MLEAKNITKSYNSAQVCTTVLKNVSFQIDKGEFVCFAGRSGSGKSTLLNIMSTLMPADEGKIIYNGASIQSLSERKINEIRHNDFSMIFQFHHLFPYLTAIENIMLPYMKSIKPVTLAAKKEAIEALAKVGLADKADRLPNQLSGGEQQRVAIARGIVKRPKILFADEPTGSLDKNNGDDIINLLKELNNDGLTILMVTHQQEYMSIGHRKIELMDGEIKQIEKSQLYYINKRE